MHNILIVDDEKIIRDLLYKILKSRDFNVYWAKNGYEAINVLKNKMIDLVITDISMPKMDGTDLANKIRYDYKNIPVVILSAHGTRDNFTKALKYGAVDFIVKGFFDLDDFVSRISQYLNGEVKISAPPKNQHNFARELGNATEKVVRRIQDTDKGGY